MSIESQADVAEEFVRGLVRCFGIDASTSSTISDEAVKVTVEGSGVGILIGSRGSTIDALQELTRTAVQHVTEEYPTRIHVDVGGYRARRATALQQFAQRVAEEVILSGEPQALEPMTAPDRKIVHDAVNDIAGVATSSEGEDPRRYVVVRPVAGAGSPGMDDEDAFPATPPLESAAGDAGDDVSLDASPGEGEDSADDDDGSGVPEA